MELVPLFELLVVAAEDGHDLRGAADGARQLLGRMLAEGGVDAEEIERARAALVAALGEP